MLLESALMAQIIIGHPNLKPTAKDFWAEGAKVVAVATIAWIAAKNRR